MTDEYQATCINLFNKARKRVRGTVNGMNPYFYADGLKEIWESFEGYLNYKYPAASATQKIDRFTQAYDSKFRKWTLSDDTKNAIRRLKELSPIKCNKPVNPGPDRHIYDEKDVKQVTLACWRVRSNLDHGTKDLERQDDVGVRNRDLVENAFKAVYGIVEKVLFEEGIVTH